MLCSSPRETGGSVANKRASASEVRRWGDPLAGYPQNAIGYVDYVGHDVSRADSEHFEILAFQPRVPSFVPLGLVAMPMTFAIYLNDQPGGRAVEVKHVAAHRVLTPDLQTAERLTAKVGPKQHRWRAHIRT